jgi:ribosomal protein S18 acetylase RimI-like enzyme
MYRRAVRRTIGSMTDRVRRSVADDRDRVAAIWTDAFAADPVIRWFLPDTTTYLAKARAIFEFMFDVRHAGGEVWVSDDVAAAGWTPPGGLAPMTPSAGERWRDVAAVLAPDEMARVETYGEALAGHLPERDTWYLAVVGTRPGYQGRGHGRAVISAVADRADSKGVAQSLETANAANRDFYQRLGYEVTAEFAPTAGILVWVMVRPPGGQSTVS